MRKLRSWNYLVAVCLALMLIAATFLASCGEPEETTTSTTSAATTSAATTSATTSSATTTSATTTAPPTTTTPAVPVSILGCPQGDPTPGLVPQYGGTLELIYQNSPSNLGAPWEITTAHDLALTRFAVESLVGLDELGNPIPQLASDWDIDLDNMTIEFTLREGVVFHDGTPFNAEAVKWCLEKYMDGVKPDLDAVASIDIIDDNHLTLNLSSWDPLFIQNINVSGAGRMVSPTAAQALGDDILANPVGTGPFEFVSFVPNVSVEYVRFDDYWQEGLPYLEGVEISINADAVVALTSFIKGEAHVLNGVATSDAADLRDEGYTIDSNLVTIMGIGWDSENPDSPFSDITVRQALAYAVNTEEAVNSVFYGMFTPTDQLALPGMQGYDTSIVGYPFDADTARDLLAEVGISTDNPLETTLTYASDPERADLYTLVQYYLADVGINITLDPVPYPTYSQSHSSGWEGLHMYGLSYNGIEKQYSSTVEANLSTRAANFVSLWIPDEFMTLLDTTKAETDWDQREDYNKQLNKMAIDDYCLVFPMFGYGKFTAKAPEVIDFGFGDRTVGEWLPERIWLNE